MQAKAEGHLYNEVVEGYFARHKVKPGITGGAQINGWRGETDTEEKIRKRIEHDLFYIENRKRLSSPSHPVQHADLASEYRERGAPAAAAVVKLRRTVKAHIWSRELPEKSRSRAAKPIGIIAPPAWRAACRAAKLKRF